MVLEKQVFLFLNIAHNSMKQFLTGSFRKAGFSLSPEQFLVMDTLWDEGVLTQQQIADITMRDKNSIVKLIDGLESRKFVKRVPSHSRSRTKWMPWPMKRSAGSLGSFHRRISRSS